MLLRACGALSNITSNNVVNHGRAGAAGCVEALLDVCIVGQRDAEPVVDKACSALWNISADPTNRTRFANAGGMGKMMPAWRQHRDNLMVVRRVLGAVCNLTLNCKPNQSQLCDAGGVQELYEAASRHRADADVVCMCNKVLQNCVRPDVLAQS